MSKEQDLNFTEIMQPYATELSQELEFHDYPPQRLDMPNIHPLKIICSLDVETDPEDENHPVTPKKPGWVAITSDYGSRSGGQSVYIMLHDSIPPPFKTVVYFHEVIQASTAHHLGLAIPEGHNTAESLTDQFAKNRLSKSQYKDFLNWKKNLQF